VIAALRGLSQHRLLDRLIRGRIWIGLIAFALIGIVTLQLGLLQLNGKIGRALEREGVVERENAVLSIENSELAASSSVESRAARLGMEFVTQGTTRFLSARPAADVTGAVAALRARPRSAETASASSAASSSAGTASESPTPAESATNTETSPSAESSPVTGTESSSVSSGESPATSAAAGTGSGEPGQATPAGG